MKMRVKYKAIVFIIGILTVGTLGTVAMIKGLNGMVLIGCINAIGLMIVYFVGKKNGR